jgi:hypothetical protein
VLGDVLGSDARRLVDQTDEGAGHAMAWTTTRIGVDGDVVGEVPGDDDEDGPAKETARTRKVCCDARRGAPCAAPVAVSSG